MFPASILKSSVQACAFTGALAATLVPRARGDIIAAHWVNDTLFNYRVTHMPDLDQRRDPLLCDGSMHCFPTSASNMVMYLANHGFPTVFPGPGYWEGDTNYATATQTIALMGVAMSTDCTGTHGTGSYDGMVSWLHDHPEILINDHLSLGNFSPTHTGLGRSLCAGRIGRIGFGRYNITGELKGIPIVDRDGGHCITLVKVRRNGATRELWVHDPASDESPDDLNSQSAFVNNIETVTDMLVIDASDLEEKWMTALNYTPGDTTVALIDGHSSLTPAEGYSFSSSLGGVALLGPMNFLNPGAPPTTVFPSPTSNPILSLDWQDLAGEYLAVVGTEVSAPTLYALDPLTHTSHALPTPLPPQIVVTGRSDDVYVSNGNEIWRMLYPAPLPPIPNPTPMLHALPQTAHAMVFDDANDDVVLISRTGRKLMRMNKSLTGIIDQRDIPTSVPMGAHVQLAISPRDPPAQKAVWLWTEGSATLYRLAPNSTGGLTITTLTHAAITNPHGLDFNDQGHMFVSNNGIVVELLQGATGWSVVSPSFFGGLPADRLLRMKRSRTNFTVGVHDQPGWDTNIDPAQLPAGPSHADCAADIAPNLDTDNVVNVNDLLVVITTWGPCASAIRCPADINGDHVVDVNDLLSVITTWGPCP